jgi:hypothetical protein
MAGLTLSASDFMFKKLYKGGLKKDSLMRGKQMLLWMEHETDFTTNKGIEIPVRYTNGQGYGASNADAATTVTSQAGKSFTVPQRHVTQYGKIDAQVIRNAQHGGGESQFVDAFEAEVDGCTESLGSELNQRSYGKSDGFRSLLSATAAINTTTLTFANAEDAQLYEVGMRIQFADPSAGTVRTGGTGYVTIQSIDSLAGTAVVDTALSTAVTSIVAADAILRWNMNGAELDGIKGWCPDTVASSGDSFLGVDRYIYRTRLAGIYKDLSTMPIKQALIKALQIARGHVGKLFDGDSPWFCNPTQMGALQLSLEAIREIETETSYDIGIRTIECMGKRLIEDEHCPVNEMILVGKGALTRGSCGDQPYVDDAGSGSKFNFNPATGQVDFTLAHDGNVYSRRPWNIMRIKVSAQAA